MMSLLTKIFSNIFFLLILVLGLSILFSYLGLTRFLIVKTGSMEPTVPVNSLVVTIPKDSFFNFSPTNIYKKGDIISFKRVGVESSVTHRVHDVMRQDSNVYYQTKGDANEGPDPILVAQKDVMGKVSFWLPNVGNLANLLRTIPGLLLLVVLPASFVILHEVLLIQEELKKFRDEEKIRLSKKTFLGPLLVLLVLAFAVPVYAFFSDSVVLTSNSLSTASSFQEIPSECVGMSFAGTPIVGSDNDDVIEGTKDNDLIFAGAGNDTVRGKGGADCIVAGVGEDKVDGGSGNDVLLGEAGSDDLEGGSGEDKVFGGDNEDILKGGSGSDELHGGLGNDTLSGGSGDDTLFGDEGEDILNGGSGGDELEGGTENNSLNGGSGSDACTNGPVITACET